MPSEIKKTSKITHKMPIFHRLAPASGSARHLRSALADAQNLQSYRFGAGRRPAKQILVHFLTIITIQRAITTYFLWSLLHGILNLESSPDLES